MDERQIVQTFSRRPRIASREGCGRSAGGYTLNTQVDLRMPFSQA